jgi:hypothetical protein
MKELQQIRMLLYSVGLLLSSTIERAITNFINGQLKLFDTNPLLYHFLSIFILIFLFIFTNVVIKSFINRKFVSKRVFGKKYVGGHWIEIVYEVTNGKDVASHYCDLEIGYDIDKIYLSGTDYNSKFKFVYNLETESASMENYSLSYLFKCIAGEKTWKGFGTINFHKKVKSSPDKYSGEYSDEENRKFRVEGFFINDREELKMLNNTFLPSFKEIVSKRMNVPDDVQ